MYEKRISKPKLSPEKQNSYLKFSLEKRHHKPNCYRKILPPQRNESYIFHGFPWQGTLNENYNKKYLYG